MFTCRPILLGQGCFGGLDFVGSKIPELQKFLERIAMKFNCLCQGLMVEFIVLGLNCGTECRNSGRLFQTAVESTDTVHRRGRWTRGVIVPDLLWLA